MDLSTHHIIDPTARQRADVVYLDEVRRVFGMYKQRSFAFIEAQASRHILDLGCGTGDDALALASIVGANGRVVGVDHSRNLIEEARRRAASTHLPLEFVEADICALPLDDESFDHCRADRVFQHLPNPRGALAEILRVTANGGWVAAYDVDWETLVVAHNNRDLTRKILNQGCDRLINGWAGRQLAGLFKQGGLSNVEPMGDTFILTDWPTANQILGLTSSAQQAVRAGVVSAEEALRWMIELEESDAAECFFSSISGFGVRGRKSSASRT